MYLPKTKFIRGVAKSGEATETGTGKSYVGPIISTYDGKTFKGSSPEEAVVELTLKLPSTLGTVDVVTGYYPTPSQEDYTKGSFTRYFIKDGRSGKILEISKETYLSNLKSPKLYLKAVKLEWYLTGELEDRVIGGYNYPGTGRKNLDVISQAEKVFPGIGQQVLNNAGEFVKNL